MPTAVPSHRRSESGSENGSDGHPVPGQEESTEFSRDGSPAMAELEADDFPTYFLERDGRLFHSSTSPYPLPVDGPEQERLKALHALANQLIGANFVGPVPGILASEERQKYVLDLCTGTGTWAMEMAEDFPHVLFRGIDIVPIATRYPLPNVDFEMGDIREELRWENGTFDFVHAREISMTVHDYRTILPEVVRVLRPGGLFLSCEWDRAVSFRNDIGEVSDATAHAPASTRFFQVVRSALESQGIQTVTSHIPAFLHGTGSFHGIVPSVHYMPIGTWHNDPAINQLCQGFLAINSRFADSVRPFLLQVGHSPGDVDTLIDNFVAELRTVNGLVGAYRVVYAIKS